MVSPAEWGPNAWKLLHGIAECVGSNKSISMVKDEKNEIRLTLRNFGSLLPCKTCQAHYREWLQKNPPEEFLKEFGNDLRDAMRTWVWKLHEDVNRRREVVSLIPCSESLSELYGSVNLRECFIKHQSMRAKGLLVRVLKPEDWNMAWRHLDLLLRHLAY
jgi:hypothetical protein